MRAFAHATLRSVHWRAKTKCSCEVTARPRSLDNRCWSSRRRSTAMLLAMRRQPSVATTCCAARGASGSVRTVAVQRREAITLPASMDDDRLWQGWSEFEVCPCCTARQHSGTCGLSSGGDGVAAAPPEPGLAQNRLSRHDRVKRRRNDCVACAEASRAQGGAHVRLGLMPHRTPSVRPPLQGRSRAAAGVVPCVFSACQRWICPVPCSQACKRMPYFCTPLVASCIKHASPLHACSVSVMA